MDDEDYLAWLQQANKTRTDCKPAPSREPNVPHVTVEDKDEQMDTSQPKEPVEKPKYQTSSDSKPVASKSIIGTVHALTKSSVVKPQATPAPCTQLSLSAKSMLHDNKIETLLWNLLKSSPALQNEMHSAIRASQLRTKTDQMVAKGGEPQLQGLVNDVKASIILDGGSVSNIISLNFALALGIK